MIDNKTILVSILEEYLSGILIDANDIEKTVLNDFHTKVSERKFIEDTVYNIRVTCDRLTESMIGAMKNLKNLE